MPIFYHVDRLRTLKSGDVLNKQPWDQPTMRMAGVEFVPNGPAKQILRAMFPGGVTSHGVAYGLGTSPMSPIEVPLELLRRAEFPAAASRFECTFASRTVAEAHAFVQSISKQTPTIFGLWAVEADGAELRDMSLLNHPHNLVQFAMDARRYWQGDRSNAPRLEALISGAATVVKMVGQFACPTNGPPLPFMG